MKTWVRFIVAAWVESQGLELMHHSREVLDHQVTDDPQKLRTEVMHQVC